MHVLSVLRSDAREPTAVPSAVASAAVTTTADATAAAAAAAVLCRRPPASRSFTQRRVRCVAVRLFAFRPLTIQNTIILILFRRPGQVHPCRLKRINATDSTRCVFVSKFVFLYLYKKWHGESRQCCAA